MERKNMNLENKHNLDDSIFTIRGNTLIRQYDCEKMYIEPWGENSLRLRLTKQAELLENKDWALLPQESCNSKIIINGNEASIVNGKICADIDAGGKITFYNQKGDILLEEYVRNRNNIKKFCSALKIDARELKPILG